MTVASVLAFLNAVDPSHALFGALVLFLLQLFAGGKLPDLSGFLKGLANKTPAPEKPLDLPLAEPVDHPVLDLVAELLKARLKARLDAGADPLEVVAELLPAKKA